MNEEDFKRYFARQLIKARLQNNLTQNDVAKHISVSNSSTINRYENGLREPSLFVLYKLIKLYDTDANFFFSTQKKETKDIPIYVMINNTNDIEEIKKAKSLLNVSNELSDCFAFVVYDNSMLPLLAKDDIVIFEKINDSNITKDGIYLIQEQKNDKATIRQITIDKKENKYILHSPNCNMPPIIKRKDELILIGKAVEARHQF